MFKKIVKISGIVLLSFVLLIGGVVAFMAIRGDFKKKIIKPDAIEFSIENSDLLFEIDTGAEKIYSFTIKSQPEDITEDECVITLGPGGSTLITFVTPVNGEWVEYRSNTFKINQPIYFKVNDIVGGNVDDYIDGVTTITVKDSSGLLHTELDLEIDRAVTSVSLYDYGNTDNNQITKGLFLYEQGTYGGKVAQNLNAIINQDYPLQLLSAPLKAEKPFATKNAKLAEIYFVEANQPKLLVHQGEVVKLRTYDDKGVAKDEDCSFLRYDESKGNYVLNSSNSGTFEFKLAMYPTYAKQEAVINNPELSLVERIGEMLTKTSIISVSGTEASEIRFNTANTNVEVNILEDNKFVANDPYDVNSTSLGIELSKPNSPEITGRYNELKFLDSESYNQGIVWKILQRRTGIQDSDLNITLKVYGSFGAYKAELEGAKILELGNVTYDAKLIESGTGYNLVLEYENPNKLKYFTVTIPLEVDSLTKQSLVMTNNTYNITIGTQERILPTEYYGAVQNSYLTWEYQAGSLMLFEKVGEGASAQFKIQTLKEGVYLAIVGTEGAVYTNYGDKFTTSIQHNLNDGAKTEIIIKPIVNISNDREVKLYAIAVNTDGSWCYTQTAIRFTFSITDTVIVVNNNYSSLYLPVVVGTALQYNSQTDPNNNLVAINGTYAGAGVLMFAPKEEYVAVGNQKPKDWGETTFYKDKNGREQADAWEEGATYYRKIINKYKMVENITITINGVTCYLLGDFDSSGFKNVIQPTGLNYYSRIYPIVPQTNYIVETGTLETAKQYIDNLVKETYVEYKDANTNVDFKCDQSLIEGRLIYPSGTDRAYQPAGNYNSGVEYYELNGGSYTPITVTSDMIANWNAYKGGLYQINQVTVMSAKGLTNKNVAGFENYTYYTIAGGIYRRVGATDVECDDSGYVVEGYFFVVDRYQIESVKFEGVGTIIATITAKPIVNDKCIGENKTFVINDYNIEWGCFGTIDTVANKVANTGVGDVYITVNSYYDFEDESSTNKPTSQTSGPYFDSTPNKNEIIAGHSNVNMGWDGVNNERPIANQTPLVILDIEHAERKTILKDIKNSVLVSAYECNADGDWVVESIGFEDVVSVSDQVTYYYIAATKWIEGATYYKLKDFDPSAPLQVGNGLKNTISQYDPNKIYYNADGDLVVPTLAHIQAWTANYTAYYEMDYVEDDTVTEENFKAGTYYIKVLCAKFNVSNTLQDSTHGIRFRWSYVMGDKIYNIDTEMLKIVSNMVTGYSIEIGDVGIFELLTEEPAEFESSQYYKKSENDKYNKAGSGESWAEETYYKFVGKADDDEINYRVEVSYSTATGDTGYRYDVYAVNANNQKYYKGTGNDGEFAAVKVADKNAFNKGSSYLIKPIPVYADYADFTISDLGTDNNASKYGAVLKFNTADNCIKSVQTGKYDNNTQFDTINIVNRTETSIVKPIKIRVEQNGKFQIDMPTLSAQSGKSYTLGDVFKYGDPYISLMNTIAIKISGVSDGYEITKGLITATEGECIIIEGKNNSRTVTLEYNGSGWVFTRSSLAEITFDVTLSTVIGDYSFTLTFDSPYNVQESTTNPITADTKIYSDTQFVLARVTDNGVTNNTYTNTIYELTDKDTDANTGFEIKYRKARSEFDSDKDYNDNTKNPYSEIDFNDYLFTAEFTGISKIVSYEFTIYYSTDNITTFILPVYPNVVITGSTSVVMLKDYQNTTYDFNNLNLYQYRNDCYTKYPTYAPGSDKFEELQLGSNAEYEYYTYTDDKYVEKYTNNIVSVENNILTVNNFISDIRTFYVKVRVKYGDIHITDMKFEVTPTSSLVDDCGQDIELIANSTTTYDLNDLKQMYKMQVDGANEYYYLTNSFVSGETYYKNEKGEYKLLSENDGSVKYKKANAPVLYDILWFDIYNTNISVTYNYSGSVQLTQTTQKLNQGGGLEIDNLTQTITYDHNKYTRVLSNCILPANIVYDMSANTFKKTDNTNCNDCAIATAGDNIVYITNNGTSVPTQQDYKAIYCKQNAYMFKNGNNILIISAESTGKVLYRFTINEESKQINYRDSDKIDLGEIESVEIKYGSYGENLTQNYEEYVDTIVYGIDAIFKTDENKMINIKDNKEYYINIKPYIIKPATTTLLAGNAYKLYDSGEVSDKGLFNISGDSHILSIDFGDNDSYITTIAGTSKSITPQANGNNYQTTIEVKLSYGDHKTTYTYNYPITVVNNNQVEITYPFINPFKKTDAKYNDFTTSVAELTQGVGEYKGALDSLLLDYAYTMGYATDDADWKNQTRIQYDIALEGDIIKMVDDNLLDLSRYQVYKYDRVAIGDKFNDKKYYQYNENTRSFELLIDGWSDEATTEHTLKYFKRSVATRTNADLSTDMVELVALNSTLDMVDADSIATSGLHKQIQLLDSLNNPGYAMFKLTDGASGAYGYYVLKIITDSNFSGVQPADLSANSRRTAEGSYKLETASTLKTIISGAKINLAETAQISSDYVSSDYSNIYLFKVSEEILGDNNATIKFDGKAYAQGERINHNCEVATSNNVQILTLAVVVEVKSMLIHICNVELIITPNITVTLGTDIKVQDAARYKYEFNDYRQYKYDGANPETANTIDFTSVGYGLTVTKDGIEKGLTSVKIINPTDDPNYPVEGEAIVDSEELVHNTWDRVANKENFKIASTSGTSLKICNPTANNISFWLKLTYADNIILYLQVKLAGFDMTPSKTFVIGEFDTNEERFKNELKFTSFFDADTKYTGSYEIYYNATGGNSFTLAAQYAGGIYSTEENPYFKLNSGILEFTPRVSNKDIKIKVVLTSILGGKSEIYNISIKSNIYSKLLAGSSSDAPAIATQHTGDVQKYASYIEVVATNINDNFYSIDIGGYQTIYIQSLTELKFSFPTVDGFDYSKYIISGAEFTPDFSGTHDTEIRFAHTSEDLILLLETTIYTTSDEHYTPQSLYVKLPKSYTLTSQYMTKDATYESVQAGTDLTFDQVYEMDANGDYNRLATDSTATEYYTLKATLIETDSYSGTCYVLDDNGNYKQAEYVPATHKGKAYSINATPISATDILSKHLFGARSDIPGFLTDAYYARFNLKLVSNTSLDGNTYLATMMAMGFMDTNNPNYLQITRKEGLSSGVDNKSLKFEGVETFIISISNNTISDMEYEFHVVSGDDYGQVKYNNNLLQIDKNNNKTFDPGDNDDYIADYIAVTHQELQLEEFALAYLRYMPTADATPGSVVVSVNYLDGSDSSETISFKFVSYIGTSSAGTTGYTSKIVVDSNGLDLTKNYKLTVYIITVNGLSSTVELIVTNFYTKYEYASGGGNYESMYGGEEGVNILDNRITIYNGYAVKTPDNKFEFDANGKLIPQVKITLDKDSFGEDITYFGGVDGQVAPIGANGIPSHLALGTTLNYTEETDKGNGLISWDKNNNRFSIADVSDARYVTLMFNIIQNDYIIGRVYYCIYIQNNYLIAMNPNLNAGIVNLYLGSSIYTQDGDTITIDLFKSTAGSAYNNVYVTLYSYSDDRYLYNGSSCVETTNISNYLSFSISNRTGELSDTNISIDTSGKIVIKGNPSGTFNLNVQMNNGSSYAETFEIAVHPYYDVIAHYNNSINTNDGAGYKSGENVNLYNTGNEGNINNYAINVLRQSVINVKGDIKYLTNEKTGAGVFYQSHVFAGDTKIADIHKYTEWSTEHEITSPLISVNLPTVPYPSDPNTTEYYIVAYRVTIITQGATQEYYALYKVYNDIPININPYYIDKDRVITYGDTNGAWKSGDSITLMDVEGEGMYSLLTPVLDKDAPEDWGASYYKLNLEVINGGTMPKWKAGIYYEQYDGSYYRLLTVEPNDWDNPIGSYYKLTGYEQCASGETYKAGYFYKINDAIENVKVRYEYVDRGGNFVSPTESGIMNSNKVTASLPTDMFDNSVDVNIVVMIDGVEVINQQWTLMADKLVKAKQSIPLSKFFLRSEIGDTYYRESIIGITGDIDNSNSFVELKYASGANAEGDITISESSEKCSYNDYKLYEVTFSADSSTVSAGGPAVFKSCLTAYVLYHSSGKAIEVSHSAGSITLIVQDSTMDGDDSIPFDLSGFIRVWSGTAETTPNIIITEKPPLSDDIDEVDNASIKLKGVINYTSNPSCKVEIAGEGATRTITVVFKIIINRKSENTFKYNSDVADTSKVSDGIVVDTNLKLSLLELITLDGKDIEYNSGDEYINGSMINRFTIKVKDDNTSGGYKITYTYNDGIATYTRTFNMSPPTP